MMEALQKQNQALQAGGGVAAVELQKKLQEQQAKEAELEKREEEAMQRAKELEAQVKELEASGGTTASGDGGGADSAEMAELKAQLAAQKENAAKMAAALKEQKAETNQALKALGVDASSIMAKRQMEEMLKQKAKEMNAMLDIENS